jgi:hypothetical protein
MKVLGCQPIAPAAFTTQEIFLVLISIRGWVNHKGHSASGRIGEWNIPITQSEIEPATFRLVVEERLWWVFII